MSVLSTDNAESDGVSDAVVKWTTALSAVLALLGTLGTGAIAIAGSVERIFREQLVLSVAVAIAFIVGFVCLGLAVVLTPGKSESSRARRTRWIGASVPLFALALVGGVVTAGKSAVADQEPTLTAKLVLGDTPTVEGEVKTSGLRSSERIAVSALGYRVNGGEAISLFRALVGPNRDGSVVLPFSFPLPANGIEQVVLSAWNSGVDVPDCNRAERNDQPGVACALVRPLPSIDSGSVTAERNDRGVLTGVARANVAASQAVVVSVNVEGQDTAAYRQEVRANASGSIEVKIPSIPTQPSARVCVQLALPGTGPCAFTEVDVHGIPPLSWVVLPSLTRSRG